MRRALFVALCRGGDASYGCPPLLDGAQSCQARTKLLSAHFMPYQRRMKMMPRMFSSSEKAAHMPQSASPQCTPKR